jgi:hypothetical protein
MRGLNLDCPLIAIWTFLLGACAASDDGEPFVDSTSMPSDRDDGDSSSTAAEACDVPVEASSTGDVLGASSGILDDRSDCEQARDALIECGLCPSAEFMSSCESAIDFGESCTDECYWDVRGCYLNGTCDTEEQIAACVSAAGAWESCLCESETGAG